MKEKKMEKTYTTEVIKWDNVRGFGFLVNPDASGMNLFCHVSGLVGRYRLIPGELVSFEIAANPRGPMAVNVRVVKSLADTVNENDLTAKDSNVSAATSAASERR